MDRKRRVVLLLAIGIGVLTIAGAARDHGITIRKARAGTATLRQQGRLTILEIKFRAGSFQRIPLSHPSDYLQTANPPSDAELVAESPNHFLIFTDTFASNPGNPQGQCGADGEERFVHVVALETIPHETLSVLMDSCLLGWEASSQSPKWIRQPDTAGFEGRIVLSFAGNTPPTVCYYVAPDGAVSRAETGPNANCS